jgi:hypothetical protein
MRRLALPLALSLAGHALVLGLAWLLPPPRAPTRRGADVTAGPRVLMSILWGPKLPVRPRPAPTPHGPWMGVDIQPQLIVPRAAQTTGPVGISVASDGGPSGVPAEPGGGAATGAPAPPLLAVPGGARCVVYLLDRSLSMGDALDRARAEVAASLRALPPEALFQVLPYNRTVSPLMPGLTPAAAEQVARAIVRLEDLAASSSTDHVGALLRGLALRPDVLFLLTDADDLRDADVLAVTHANARRAAIHVVEFCRGGGHPDSPLARLAALNAGNYRCVGPDR